MATKTNAQIEAQQKLAHTLYGITADAEEDLEIFQETRDMETFDQASDDWPMYVALSEAADAARRDYDAAFRLLLKMQQV